MNEIDFENMEHIGCGGMVFILESGTIWCMGCDQTWREIDGGNCEGQERSSDRGRRYGQNILPERKSSQYRQ